VGASVEWLILCHSTDASALWAARGLQRRLDGRVDVVTPELLAFATLLEHRIGGDGQLVRIQLADGRVIRSEQLRGVVNRIVSPWVEHWRSKGPSDAEYVMAEAAAFHLGWLSALTVPVLNPPSPSSLAGAFVRPGEVRSIAFEMGIGCEPFTRSTRDGKGADVDDASWHLRAANAVVVARRVFGIRMTSSLKERCVRLSDALGTPLLGLTFRPNPAGEPSLEHATPLPDLRVGGEALMDVLAGRLAEGAP
jgi:hypothetical protein